MEPEQQLLCFSPRPPGEITSAALGRKGASRFWTLHAARPSSGHLVQAVTPFPHCPSSWVFGTFSNAQGMDAHCSVNLLITLRTGLVLTQLPLTGGCHLLPPSFCSLTPVLSLWRLRRRQFFAFSNESPGRFQRFFQVAAKASLCEDHASSSALQALPVLVPHLLKRTWNKQKQHTAFPEGG